MKLRYIAAIIVSAVSIAVTPLCIQAAYRHRGYHAYGGEYLVIPLGFLAAYIILEAAKFADKLIQLKKDSAAAKKEWVWEYGKCR